MKNNSKNPPAQHPLKSSTPPKIQFTFRTTSVTSMVAQTFVLLNMLVATSTVLASSSTFLRRNAAALAASSTSSYKYCSDEKWGVDAARCSNLRNKIAEGGDASESCADWLTSWLCKKSCNYNNCRGTTTSTTTELPTVAAENPGCKKENIAAHCNKKNKANRKACKRMRKQNCRETGSPTKY